MFRVKPTARFERSLKDLIRARYRRNPKAEQALLAFLEKTLAELAVQGRLPGARSEPWPAGAHREGWELWKYYFSAPGQHGAAGEGRLMYLVDRADAAVWLIWIYTHAEFSKRPPDEALRAVFVAAIDDDGAV